MNNQNLKQLECSLFILFLIFILLSAFLITGFSYYKPSEFQNSINAENILKLLQFLGTSFASIAILFNVYYAAKRATALDKTALAAEKNIEVAQNSQITERFTKAVEQLGSENLSIRLGGIYALEKIAQDAPKTYHWTIMEILCAFIRNHELSWEKTLQNQK
ncbi:hypothetical protein cce_2892 [Crocosphaera subtropica ATCC 51142]|uniref:Uncharacterized protein n=1 Tax=Crocosphaera subtropica (strain ATCC 51142 / BH68) TaxID=43989 RepID=B1WV43_CROS5|nr:hypothetical protein [Crocosphaera subtropica]ACB52240.1 hypothetical protein cce_2892 [Crocosphaera subtropica ATCC 51142]